MTISTEVPHMEVLTASDRCDRCGAQAMVAVEFQPGDSAVLLARVLLFCAHHANEHMDKIRGYITLLHHDAELTAGAVTVKS